MIVRRIDSFVRYIPVYNRDIHTQFHCNKRDSISLIGMANKDKISVEKNENDLYLY